MRTSKHQKAEYLFREIGSVRDALLQEAMDWHAPQKASIWSVRHIPVLAACLLLAVTVGMSGLLRNWWRASDSSDGAENRAPGSLDSLLVQVSLNEDLPLWSSEGVAEFFGGRSYVVWQYGEAEELCVSRALEKGELELLLSEIENGTRVGEESPRLNCKVWIVLGDGEVLSPYLENTEGNRFTAAFSDYEAELIPSERFVSIFSDILESERMD